MFEVELGVDYWEIWTDTRKKLICEFKLTEEEFDSIITFCYGSVNCEADTYAILELPFLELKRAIKRTIPKLKDLKRLTRRRQRFSDTDSDFMEEDILVKRNGRWTNIKFSEYIKKES